MASPRAVQLLSCKTLLSTGSHNSLPHHILCSLQWNAGSRCSTSAFADQFSSRWKFVKIPGLGRFGIQHPPTCRQVKTSRHLIPNPGLPPDHLPERPYMDTTSVGTNRWVGLQIAEGEWPRQSKKAVTEFLAQPPCQACKNHPARRNSSSPHPSTSHPACLLHAHAPSEHRKPPVQIATGTAQTPQCRRSKMLSTRCKTGTDLAASSGGYYSSENWPCTSRACQPAY